MDKEKFEPLFPPRYAHLEEPVRKVQAQLNDIDKELGRLPKDGGLRPDFTPSEVIEGGSDKYHKRAQDLNKQKAVLRDGIRDKVETLLHNVDPKDAAKIREALEINIGDDGVRNLTRKESKEYLAKPKELDKASDAAQKAISDRRADRGYEERATIETAHERYFSQLKSHQLKQRSGMDKEIGKEFDQNKDDIELEPER